MAWDENIRGITAFCREHMGYRGSSPEVEFGMAKLMLTVLFHQPEVQAIVQCYPDEPEVGMDKITDRCAPICCFLGETLLKRCLHEAAAMEKWGPRLPAPSFDSGPYLVDLR